MPPHERPGGSDEFETRQRAALRDEYARLAPVYDTRWSFYIETTVRETIRRLTPNPGARVLDVGCGTGVLLQRLLTDYPGLTLAGVDASEAMLARARERLPPDVDLRTAWAEDLPFADASFDTIACCNMFHYLPQAEDALREMYRVLGPGGELVITDWCDDYLACRICDWYLRWFNAAHVKVYGVAQFGKLLKRAGLAEHRIERYRISLLWGMMTAVIRKPASPK